MRALLLAVSICCVAAADEPVAVGKLPKPVMDHYSIELILGKRTAVLDVLPDGTIESEVVK
jgi:hypothetical protein